MQGKISVPMCTPREKKEMCVSEGGNFMNKIFPVPRHVPAATAMAMSGGNYSDVQRVNEGPGLEVDYRKAI